MKKHELLEKLKRYVPAGQSPGAEVRTFLVGLVAAALYSMIYLIRYFTAREELYEWTRKGWQLREGAVMADFSDLMAGMMLGLVAVALWQVGIAIYHYIYHYQDTKSIYTMRRLPNPWELHRRCLALPAAGVLICGVAALVLILIYFWVYMGCTPQECLTPGQWQKFWL